MPHQHVMIGLNQTYVGSNTRAFSAHSPCAHYPQNPTKKLKEHKYPASKIEFEANQSPQWAIHFVANRKLPSRVGKLNYRQTDSMEPNGFGLVSLIFFFSRSNEILPVTVAVQLISTEPLSGINLTFSTISMI